MDCRDSIEMAFVYFSPDSTKDDDVWKSLVQSERVSLGVGRGEELSAPEAVLTCPNSSQALVP